MSAPSLRPIQLRWMSLIDSGQSRTLRSSSRRSAYAVMRIFHCFNGRLKTGKLPRSLRPSARHLFVRQHRAQAGAPVHRRIVEIDEAERVDDAPPLDVAELRPLATSGDRPGACLELGDQLRDGTGAIGRRVVPGVEDLQEDPLRPPVERHVGGRHRAAGIVPQTESVELTPIVGNVCFGRDAGVLPRLNRVLLRGQAERVVAHGVQHVVAGHAQVARVHVGADEAERVADMQAVAARIREHVEHEHLRPVRHFVEAGRERPRGIGGVVGALVVPPLLPARLDLLGESTVIPMGRDVIVPGRGHRFGRSVARGHEI